MTRKPPGFTVMEILAAAVILAAVLAVCVQLVRATTQQRRALQTRELTIQEAANLMERLAGMTWQELAGTQPAQLCLSGDALRAIPGAELKVEVVSCPGQPEAKRIAVAIAWQDDSARPVRPVRIVAWRYRAAEGAGLGPKPEVEHKSK